MRGVKIERIFGAQLKAGEAQELVYVPHIIQRRAVGLLFSNDVSLSLSFDNGTNLMFNQFPANQSPDFAPDQRIVELDKQLNCEVIKGMVISKTTQTANVYLLIENNQ